MGERQSEACLKKLGDVVTDAPNKYFGQDAFVDELFDIVDKSPYYTSR